MKAIVYEKYGSPDNLKLNEIEKPFPSEGEVLVKVHAASVNAFDWHVLRADPFVIRLMGFGFLKPKNKIPGADFSGVVEAVGVNVKGFKPGDEVFGCGRGSFAEYLCIGEDKLGIKSKELSFSQAAAIPMAALTALQGLRDYGHIQKGKKVLIEGVSGGVGTFAVQIAKSFGAEVTAVCSTAKIDTARSTGADHVIDYTKEDFTKSNLKYNLVYAANGYHSIFDYKRVIEPNGICVMSGGNGSIFSLIKDMILELLISKTTNRKILSFIANINGKDLVYLNELVEAGKLKPVIDRKYPLSESAEAIHYLEEGHAKGKVIIMIEDKEKT
jgi:NADPH:quinone reductase-like Zn-dependent oxidoreductase